MIRKTLEAIAIQLKKEFNENYEIWVDAQEQGLKEPCFFIQIVENSQTPQLTDFYKRDQTFDIIYFPETPNTFEFTQIADRLYVCLEYIKVDEALVRGGNMHMEIVEDTLHFIVSYSFILVKTRERDAYMENLMKKGGLK